MGRTKFNMSVKAKRDNVICSLGDAVIRESDLHLLGGPYWLSDRIIGFYFEYLHKVIFEDSHRFCFISPEVSQFLKLVSKEEMNCFVEPLQLETKDVILLAVNNADDPSRPGGSHWSLLVYTSQANHFYHFDSSSGMNQDDARILSKKISQHLSNGQKGSEAIRFTEAPGIVQQSNGYDCGVHVLKNAEHCSRHLMLYGTPEGLPHLQEKEIIEMRSVIKALILKMSTQGDSD